MKRLKGCIPTKNEMYLFSIFLPDLSMKLFIVSMLLAAVYTVGSCYRPTAGRRTPFVTRSQFARMCAEIVSIKEANSNLQKTVTDLEQRLEDQEQISKDAG